VSAPNTFVSIDSRLSTHGITSAALARKRRFAARSGTKCGVSVPGARAAPNPDPATRWMQRRESANQFTLMLIVVVFESVPEVDVTATEAGPFGVEVDVDVQPMKPAMTKTTSASERQSGSRHNGTILFCAARKSDERPASTVAITTNRYNPHGPWRLVGGGRIAFVVIVNVVLPDVLPADVFVGLSAQVVPISDAGTEQV
jgi:hypothetical protein